MTDEERLAEIYKNALNPRPCRLSNHGDLECVVRLLVAEREKTAAATRFTYEGTGGKWSCAYSPECGWGVYRVPPSSRRAPTWFMTLEEAMGFAKEQAGVT